MMRYFITKGYLGKRLFRWNTETGKVLQVVIDTGKEKKGRAHCLGIYNVSEATLKGNYLWQLPIRNIQKCTNNNVMETTESLFNYWMEVAIKKLKNK